MADTKIGIDISDAIEALTELTGSVTNTVDSISSSFKALAVGGTFIAFLTQATHAAIEQEDAINRLNVALKLNGNFTEETTKSLQEYAETLQKSSKFSDDAILNNIALLQSLAPLSERGLKVASQAAIDLASALRIDLGTAFELVAKAANGNISAFSRYGIEIKKGQSDAETFANTLDVLGSKFGGTAQSELKTFSGGLTQLKNTFGDLLEEIGNVIIKNEVVIGAFSSVVSIVQGVTSELKQLNQGYSKSSDAITELAKQYNESRIEFEITNETFAKNAGIYDLVIERAQELTQQQKQLAASLPEFQNATDATDSFVASLSSAATSMNQVGEATKNTALFLANAKKEVIDFSSQIKSLEGSLKNAGLNQLEIIKKERDERLKLINDALKAEQISAEKASKLRLKTQADFFSKEKDEREKIAKIEKEQQQKLNDLREKQLKKQKDDIEAFTSLLQGKQRNGQGNAQDVDPTSKIILAGAATLGAISKGAQGALDVIKAGITTALSFFGPLGTAIGELAGPLIDALAQGPEKVRELVTSFLESFPIIIENVIASIPELFIALAEQIGPLIETLLEAIPEAILSFLERLPEVVIALIEGVVRAGFALAAQMPFVATRFAIELIAQTPKMAVAFIDQLVKEAPRFITELIKSIPSAGVGAVQSVGGLFSGIGDIFGFAEGGRIPNDPRFKNDGAIIRADAGEQILSSDLSAKLEQYLKGNSNSSAQNLTVNLSVGEADLAKVMLNLNRNGFRVV